MIFLTLSYSTINFELLLCTNMNLWLSKADAIVLSPVRGLTQKLPLGTSHVLNMKQILHM